MKKKRGRPLRSPKLEERVPYPEECNHALPEAQNREDQETILGLIAR